MFFTAKQNVFHTHANEKKKPNTRHPASSPPPPPDHFSFSDVQADPVKQRGPLALIELHALWEKGAIDRDTFVWYVHVALPLSRHLFQNENFLPISAKHTKERIIFTISRLSLRFLPPSLLPLISMRTHAQG